MPRVQRFEHYGEAYGFECPGCDHLHILPVTGDRGWGFNRDLDLPTFSPSILVRFTYEGEGGRGVCHSFVTDGKIRFLDDCTHALKGRTVDLPEVSDA